MTEEDDIDGLAAEYVLGSLDPAERAQVDARRKTDAPLAAAVEAWERRLGPLNEQVAGIEPPAHVYDDIVARISGSQAQSAASAEVIPFRRDPRRRLRFASGASALAACLALAVVWYGHTPPGHPRGVASPTWDAAAGTRISGRASIARRSRGCRLSSSPA